MSYARLKVRIVWHLKALYNARRFLTHDNGGV
jgi:hypothetical protein